MPSPFAWERGPYMGGGQAGANLPSYGPGPGIAPFANPPFVGPPDPRGMSPNWPGLPSGIPTPPIGIPTTPKTCPDAIVYETPSATQVLTDGTVLHEYPRPRGGRMIVVTHPPPSNVVERWLLDAEGNWTQVCSNGVRIPGVNRPGQPWPRPVGPGGTQPVAPPAPGNARALQLCLDAAHQAYYRGDMTAYQLRQYTMEATAAMSRGGSGVCPPLPAPPEVPVTTIIRPEQPGTGITSPTGPPSTRTVLPGGWGWAIGIAGLWVDINAALRGFPSALEACQHIVANWNSQARALKDRFALLGRAFQHRREALASVGRLCPSMSAGCKAEMNKMLKLLANAIERVAELGQQAQREIERANAYDCIREGSESIIDSILGTGGPVIDLATRVRLRLTELDNALADAGNTLALWDAAIAKFRKQCGCPRAENAINEPVRPDIGGIDNNAIRNF